jgi:hypothetical protein
MTALEFYQVYFLTTPHRWITLLLVSTDPERRQAGTGLFVALAMAASAVVGLAWWLTGTFLCLLLVDFVWNAWHFGSQHAGILRIYGRKSHLAYSAFEKHGLRLFVLYTILRIPPDLSYSLGITRDLGQVLDTVALIVPVLLIARALRPAPPEALGKRIYQLSVASLYAAILVTHAMGLSALAAALFVGGALFHATEYLAIVTHYAMRRARGGAASPFQRMARQWALVLGVFLLVVGSLDILGQGWFFELAAGLNLIAAFLHYSYDALIWKLRQPATAASLGVAS